MSCLQQQCARQLSSVLVGRTKSTRWHRSRHGYLISPAELASSVRLGGVLHMQLSVGEKLGRYELLAPIGHGGMGEVWKAHDPRLNRNVAIKVSSAQFSDRFEREAKAIAALNHPNICQIYDIGPNYLVMEYVDGVPVVSPDQQPLTVRNYWPTEPVLNGT